MFSQGNSPPLPRQATACPCHSLRAFKASDSGAPATQYGV